MISLPLSRFQIIVFLALSSPLDECEISALSGWVVQVIPRYRFTERGCASPSSSVYLCE